jgi:polyisoprenyl-teichoic acid--peptidoglycan teichoic acid transferase
MNYVDLKSGARKSAKKTGGDKKGFFSYLLAIIAVGMIALVVINAARIKTALAGMLDPINIVSTVSGSRGEKLKETDGRTNVLILGTDQRSFGDQMGSMLTDTIMIISVGKSTEDAVIISLPRDLWVESSQGGRYKINELYGSYGGKDGTGSAEILKAVQDVLGVPVHYYGVVNFALFEESINTLGGIDVNVENSFEDYEYPIEGKEADRCGRSDEEIEDMGGKGQSYVEIFPCRYEHLKFVKGPTKMNGETALKYSRSRHGNGGENTDFARAKRQQNVIMAVKQKALSPQTLLDFSKIKSLYELYSKNVDTSLDLSSLQVFYTLAQSADFNNTRTLVLDDRSESENGGLLYAPTDLTLYGGKYVLIPKAGDYSQIHAYIQKYLFN